MSLWQRCKIAPKQKWTSKAGHLPLEDNNPELWGCILKPESSSHEIQLFPSSDDSDFDIPRILCRARLEIMIHQITSQSRPAGLLTLHSPGLPFLFSFSKINKTTKFLLALWRWLWYFRICVLVVLRRSMLIRSPPFLLILSLRCRYWFEWLSWHSESRGFCPHTLAVSLCSLHQSHYSIRNTFFFLNT